MRLTELEANFVQVTTDGFRVVGTFAASQGVVFDCPCTKHSILIWFRDHGVQDTAVLGAKQWEVAGTTLESLSLSPSISLDCWHGYVTRGEVTTI